MAQQGFLDSVDGLLLKGWARDDAASPAQVDIRVNGFLVATIECSEFRPDLAAAHIGDGRHGFSYLLPSEYQHISGTLTVSFAGGGPALTRGERVRPDLLSRVFTSFVMARGLWRVEHLTVSDAEVAIDGWCVPPAPGVPFAITHNGCPLELSRQRPTDPAFRLETDLDAAGFGFRARAPVAAKSTSHEFRFEHAHTRQPFDPNQTVHYLVSDAPLPPETLRLRVHGATDLEGFVREGSSTFVRIERVLATYFGKSVAGFHHVLDWGCGSGRVLRYLSGVSTRVTGIDIDREAMEWCRQAFPQWQFVVADRMPPVTAESGTFDLIYGISVLTHLTAGDQLAWLEELQRISRPGAAVLLTTLGDTCWWRSRRPWKQHAEWKIDGQGIYNAGRNSDLDEIGVSPEYYRNVYVSHEYIARVWPRYFDIVDMLPGAIGNLQDLIILRRR